MQGLSKFSYKAVTVVSQKKRFLFGVPKRIIVFQGLYWGLPILGNYHDSNLLGGSWDLVSRVVSNSK